MKRIILLLVFNFSLVFISAQEVISDNPEYPFLANDLEEKIFSSPFVYIQSKNLKERFSSKIVRMLSPSEAIIKIPEDLKLREATIRPVDDTWKLSSYLSNQIEELKKKDLLKIRFLDSESSVMEEKLKERIPSINVIHNLGNIWLVDGVDYSTIYKLLSISSIIHVERHFLPDLERFINGLDLSTNQVNLLKSKFPSINGENIGVALQENNVRVTDIDLLGKVVNTLSGSQLVDDHATNMATIIAGWGNSHKTGEGVARYAEIFPIDFQFILPLEYDSYPDHVRTTNHSYGTDINNYYGVEAREFDAHIFDHPELIHVFSAGNKGDSTSVLGAYAGISQLANLSGSIKQAKNTILVGAIDSFGIVESRSSRGPAYDGRIKPDLVAYGEDGTSGAAAIVSGISVLLQEYYNEKYGVFPGSKLIKACMIASAKDTHNPGPDYVSGYGIARAYDAMKVLDSEQYYEDEVSPQTPFNVNLIIPEGTAQVRIALTWIDAPANEGDFKSLVNDLDLKLFNEIDQQFLPQILTTEGSQEELLQPSIEGEDHINNTELIVIDNPQSLLYRLSVMVHKSIDEVIPFAVAYHFVPEDSFTWEFPSANDRLDSKRKAFLRWTSTYEKEVPGRLSLKNLKTNEVSFIEDIDGLKSGVYADLDWPIGLYQLIMEIEDSSYYSDAFTIYPGVQHNLINQCGQELLVEWDFDPGVEFHQLLTIRQDTLIPFLTTSSRRYEFVDISDLNTPYIAIKPFNEGGAKGNNSYTLNVDFVKPPCYIKFFNGYLENDDKIILNLILSTTREIDDISFYRNTAGIPELLNSYEPSFLNYSTSDDKIKIGDNMYSIEITLKNGNVISEDISIEYIPPGIFEILQNPVLEGDDIVIKKNAEQSSIIDLFNAQGYKVRTQTLNGSLIFIDTSGLPSGSYPYVIYSGDDVLKNGFIIII